MKEISEFLQSIYPDRECAIIGCQVDKDIKSHRCCEFDIIVLSSTETVKVKQQQCPDHQFLNLSKNNLNSILEIYHVDRDNFLKNSEINYLEYHYIPTRSFNYKKSDIFKKKAEYNLQEFDFNLRKNVITDIFKITKLINFLSKENTDISFCSFCLKMVSFDTLKTLIQGCTKNLTRPSHIKSQGNNIMKESGIKVREIISTLYDYTNIERANTSILKRSERSLRFLLRYDNTQKYFLLYKKLEYFQNNSMYVDGYLLINDFINTQNFNNIFIKNYKNLLNYLIDTQIKEKITMLSEANILLDINKSFLAKDKMFFTE